MNKYHLSTLSLLLITQSAFSENQHTKTLRDPFSLPNFTCSVTDSTSQHWTLFGIIGTNNNKTAWLKEDKNWFAIQKGDPLPNSLWHVAKIYSHSVLLNPVSENTAQCSDKTLLEIGFSTPITQDNE